MPETNENTNSTPNSNGGNQTTGTTPRNEGANFSSALDFARLRALSEALQVARNKIRSNNVSDCLRYISQNITSDPDLSAYSALVPNNTADMSALLRSSIGMAGRNAQRAPLIPTPAQVDYQKGVFDKKLADNAVSLREARTAAETNYNNAIKNRNKHVRGMLGNALGFVATVGLSIAAISLGATFITGASAALMAGASLTSGVFLLTAGVGILAAKGVIKGLGALFNRTLDKFKEHRLAFQKDRQNRKELKNVRNRARENYNENASAIEASNAYGYVPVDQASYNRGRGLVDEFAFGEEFAFANEGNTNQNQNTNQNGQNQNDPNRQQQNPVFEDEIAPVMMQQFNVPETGLSGSEATSGNVTFRASLNDAQPITADRAKEILAALERGEVVNEPYLLQDDKMKADMNMLLDRTDEGKQNVNDRINREADEIRARLERDRKEGKSIIDTLTENHKKAVAAGYCEATDENDDSYLSSHPVRNDGQPLEGFLTESQIKAMLYRLSDLSHSIIVDEQELKNIEDLKSAYENMKKNLAEYVAEKEAGRTATPKKRGRKKKEAEEEKNEEPENKAEEEQAEKQPEEDVKKNEPPVNEKDEKVVEEEQKKLTEKDLTAEDIDILLADLDRNGELLPQDEEFFAENEEYQAIKRRIMEEQEKDWRTPEEVEAEKQQIKAEIAKIDQQRTAWVEAAKKDGRQIKGDKIPYTRDQRKHDELGIPYKNEITESNRAKEEYNKQLDRLENNVSSKENFDAALKAQRDFLLALKKEKEDQEKKNPEDDGPKGPGGNGGGNPPTNEDEQVFVAESYYNAEVNFKQIQTEIEQYNKAIEDYNAGKISYEELKTLPIGESTFEKVISEPYDEGNSLAYRIALHGTKNKEKKYKIDTKKIAEKPQDREFGLREMLKEAKKEVKRQERKALADVKAGGDTGIRKGNQIISNIGAVNAKFRTGDAQIDAFFAGKSVRECQRMIDMLFSPNPGQRARAQQIFGDLAKSQAFKNKLIQEWNEFKQENNIVIVKDSTGKEVALQFNVANVQAATEKELKAAVKDAAKVDDSTFADSSMTKAMSTIKKAAKTETQIGIEETEEKKTTSGTGLFDYSGLKDAAYASFLAEHGLPRGKDARNQYLASKALEAQTTSAVKKTTPATKATSAAQKTAKANGYWAGYEAFLEKNGLQRGTEAQAKYREFKAAEKASAVAKTTPATKATSAAQKTTKANGYWAGYEAFLEKNGLQRGAEAQAKYREFKAAEKTSAAAKTTPATKAAPAEKKTAPVQKQTASNAPKNAEYAAFKEEYKKANPGATNQDALNAFRAKKREEKSAVAAVKTTPATKTAPVEKTEVVAEKPEATAEVENKVPPMPEVKGVPDNGTINESGEIIREDKTKENLVEKKDSVAGSKIEPVDEAQLKAAMAEQEDYNNKITEIAAKRMKPGNKTVEKSSQPTDIPDVFKQEPKEEKTFEELVAQQNLPEDNVNVNDLQNISKQNTEYERNKDLIEKSDLRKEFVEHAQSNGVDLKDPSQLTDKVVNDFVQSQKAKQQQENESEGPEM